MMRVEMPKALKPGDKFVFSIKWWYNIPDHTVDRARSGYEVFEDGNKGYVIAQFYPRMAVYSDVEGWQNSQFWGRDEFALPFGNFEVSITVPSDHVLDATGVLVNRKEVFSKEMMRRYELAKKSYDKPVLIVTQDEAERASTGFATGSKTWKFDASGLYDLLDQKLENTSVNITKDMHCWDLSVRWYPTGINQGFYLRFGIKAS